MEGISPGRRPSTPWITCKPMPVPLFDNRPLAAAADDVRAKVAAVLDKGRVRARRGGPRLRGRVRRLSRRPATRSAWPTARTRSCSRCARSASGRATTWSCRRSRSTPRAEAIALTGARPVFCDVDPRHVLRHAGDGARGADAGHQGGDRRPPVRQRRARRGDRGARRARRRGRRPGRRLAQPRPAGPGRWARSRRSPSTRPRTSARSATAARSRPATTRSPSGVRMLRFHGSRDKQTFELVGHNSRLDELQAGILRVLLPAPRRLVRRPPRRRARTTPRRAWASSSRCREPTPGSAARVAPLRRPPRRADALLDGAERRRDRRARLLPHAGPPPAGDGASAPRRLELPGTDEAARTNLAIPMSPVLCARAEADEVVAAVRVPALACASGSTSPTRRTCSSCGR